MFGLGDTPPTLLLHLTPFINSTSLTFCSSLLSSFLLFLSPSLLSTLLTPAVPYPIPPFYFHLLLPIIAPLLFPLPLASPFIPSSDCLPLSLSISSSPTPHFQSLPLSVSLPLSDTKLPQRHFQHIFPFPSSPLSLSCILLLFYSPSCSSFIIYSSIPLTIPLVHCSSVNQLPFPSPSLRFLTPTFYSLTVTYPPFSPPPYLFLTPFSSLFVQPPALLSPPHLSFSSPVPPYIPYALSHQPLLSPLFPSRPSSRPSHSL